MTDTKPEATIILRGMAGALIGAVIGWFAFDWIVGQGLYALALPGALLGLGCGLFAGGVSTVNAVLCAILAGALGLVLEWWHLPFVADESFGFFLSNLHELKPITWLMVALGSVFGYWFGRGSSRPLFRSSPSQE
jgi:hypothetical protein